MPAESPLRNRRDADFQLIETLRWEPGRGFLRLDLHLDRLRHSARQLGFALPNDPRGVLEAATGGNVPLRVRMTLTSDGEPEVATQVFAPSPDGVVWRLKIAATRVDPADPLIAHKTTRRGIYETARAEFLRDECEEVLLRNERGELCEGTITNLFLDRGAGPLLTPASSSGLLRGVLRAEMLREGRAIESVLTTDDLRSVYALFVGNSLRGLIPARLV